MERLVDLMCMNRYFGSPSLAYFMYKYEIEKAIKTLGMKDILL